MLRWLVGVGCGLVQSEHLFVTACPYLVSLLLKPPSSRTSCISLLTFLDKPFNAKSTTTTSYKSLTNRMPARVLLLRALLWLQKNPNLPKQELDWEHILIKYQFVLLFRKINLCYISGDCVAASLNMGHLTGVVFPFVIEPWLPLLLLAIVRNLLDEKLRNGDIVLLYISWQIILLCQFVKTQ